MHRCLRQACFEEQATMEGFDFTASPKLPAAQIRDLAALRWLHARESLILYGPVGVGKATSCGCRKPCQLCDLGIFTDQAAEPVAPHHPDIRAYCGRMRASSGRFVLQRPVRPMKVAMVYVLAEDQQQVPLAGDQHPVQAFAAGTGDPASGYSVRARRLPRKRSHAGSGGESSRPRYRHRPAPRQRPR
jgi:hypothetical protein